MTDKDKSSSTKVSRRKRYDVVLKERDELLSLLDRVLPYLEELIKEVKLLKRRQYMRDKMSSRRNKL